MYGRAVRTCRCTVDQVPRGPDVIVNSSLLHECASEGPLLRPVATVKDGKRVCQGRDIACGVAGKLQHPVLIGSDTQICRASRNAVRPRPARCREGSAQHLTFDR